MRNSTKNKSGRYEPPWWDQVVGPSLGQNVFTLKDSQQRSFGIFPTGVLDRRHEIRNHRNGLAVSR